MSRQSRRVRKALRSAAAKKGRATRRENARELPTPAMREGLRLHAALMMPALRDDGAAVVSKTWWAAVMGEPPDPNPWPRIAFAVRRAWLGFCGWFR